MLYGKMLHGQMLHGQMLHGQMLHGQMLHGQMLHGQIVLGHLSTVKDGSTNLKCPPQYFPWGGGAQSKTIKAPKPSLQPGSGWLFKKHFNGIIE